MASIQTRRKMALEHVSFQRRSEFEIVFFPTHKNYVMSFPYNLLLSTINKVLNFEHDS